MVSNYTIFYCWQSDYDYRTNIKDDNKKDKKDKNKARNQSKKNSLPQRVEIQKILEWQAYSLGRKNKCNITVDMDTEYAPGMQPISDLVIKKIRKSHFFVCDLTPITSISGPDGNRKLMPNSNVMFELGIAISYLQPYQIIAIAHKTMENWTLRDFPFDISNRRIIKFKSATDLELELSSELEESLKQYKKYTNRFKRFLRKLSYRPLKGRENQNKQAALYYNSEVFFNNRMALAFPGIRGLKVVDKSTLTSFFDESISFSDMCPMMIIDKFGSYPIKQFEVNDDTFIIGNTEVFMPNDSSKRFSDVLVYRSKNCKFQFLYIVSQPKEPLQYQSLIQSKSKSDDDHINYENHNGYVQEYAIFYDDNNDNEIRIITKEEYEDLSLTNNDIDSQNGRFEFRRRYLREGKLLIVPTNSIFDENAYNTIVKILSECSLFNHLNWDYLEIELNKYFLTLESSKNTSESKHIMKESINDNAND